MPLVMLFAELLWFMPLFLRQGKLDAPPKKYTYFAVLAGLFAGIILGVAGTMLFGKLMRIIAPAYEGTWGYKFVYYLLAAGVAEEFAKFAIALPFIKRAKPVRKLDYILIMGASGLGFAVTESLMVTVGGAGGIINAFFPMHIMYQFFMGAHYYESVQAKQAGDKTRRTKELLLAFGVPILIHGAYDFVIDFLHFLTEIFQTAEETGGLTASQEGLLNTGSVAVLLWFAAMFAFVIVSEVRVAKLVKQSREADKAAVVAESN